MSAGMISDWFNAVIASAVGGGVIRGEQHE
jgi:hypothetical protein